MGVKRTRTEKDSAEGQNGSIIPKDYQFNFTPTLKPNQKIFDIDLPLNTSQPPVELSVNTLTLRFNERVKNSVFKETKKNNSVVQSTEPQQTHLYEPMYLRHQDISYTIIVYIQMAFNFIISSTLIYILFKIILIIKQDFNLKTKEHIDALHRDKVACTNNYLVNQCGHSDRIPAIEDMCNEWAACMNREVVVPQAKVSAEAIAEIINSFVEPISYKTLFFFSVLILGLLVCSNIATNVFKRKHKTSIAQ